MLLALAGSVTGLFTSVPAAHAALPPVKHVFVIVLENKSYDESFGAASPAPYLTKTLTAQGQLLAQYHGTSHVSLGNYVSMVSGQAPNPITQSDCQTGYQDVVPGVPALDGQVVGAGCVYPASVPTIASQLQARDLQWKGYMQDMPRPCAHPPIGAIDDTQQARVGMQYAMRHNPFMYFHSVIDDGAGCDAHVVNLDALPNDLRRGRTTPAFSFITPNLCEDGHDAPCVDGRPGGLVSADGFLQTWVPRILGSPAWREGGMLVVTWDEGQIGPGAGSAACCDEPSGPNTPLPGIFGAGGGRTGAVVLSPWTRPGTVNGQPYNHYALLRSIEDLFGLDHLGYAARAGLKPFGADVFDQRR
jgi:hypothetical protein